MRAANLTRADLQEADLTKAYLRDADLTGANLAYANLEHARLQSANFDGADLQVANLTGADCREANFEGAHTLNTNFKDAALAGASGLTGDAVPRLLKEIHLRVDVKVIETPGNEERIAARLEQLASDVARLAGISKEESVAKTILAAIEASNLTPEIMEMVCDAVLDCADMG